MNFKIVLAGVGIIAVIIVVSLQPYTPPLKTTSALSTFLSMRMAQVEQDLNSADTT